VEYRVWSLESEGTAVNGPEHDMQAYVDEVSGGYIWQHEPMKICVSLLTAADGAEDVDKPVVGKHPASSGVTFGVNVDDEWFVVYILRKLSERFNVCIQVWDDDGEFLLIEAAARILAVFCHIGLHIPSFPGDIQV
jgi:hypothetical protein